MKASETIQNYLTLAFFPLVYAAENKVLFQPKAERTGQRNESGLLLFLFQQIVPAVLAVYFGAQDGPVSSFFFRLAG